MPALSVHLDVPHMPYNNKTDERRSELLSTNRFSIEREVHLRQTAAAERERTHYRIIYKLNELHRIRHGVPKYRFVTV